MKLQEKKLIAYFRYQQNNNNLWKNIFFWKIAVKNDFKLKKKIFSWLIMDMENFFPLSGWPVDLEFLGMSGSFVKFGEVREFYLCEMNIAEVFSKFIQVVTRISHTYSYITHAHGFLRKKIKFKLWNCLFFFLIRKWLNFITYAGMRFFYLISALFMHFIFLKSFYFANWSIIICSFYAHHK